MINKQTKKQTKNTTEDTILHFLNLKLIYDTKLIQNDRAQKICHGSEFPAKQHQHCRNVDCIWKGMEANKFTGSLANWGPEYIHYKCVHIASCVVLHSLAMWDYHSWVPGNEASVWTIKEPHLPYKTGLDVTLVYVSLSCVQAVVACGKLSGTCQLLLFPGELYKEEGS